MRRIYNKNKWLGIIHDKKYEDMRKLILSKFKDLKFIEEGHKYYLHGKEITCVSNVTHRFQKPFDVEERALATYERNFNNPDSKYYQMSVEDIKKAWKENSTHACEHGTERHEFGESLFYFMTGNYDGIVKDFKDRLKKDENGDDYFEALYPKEEAAIKFYEDMPKCVVPILAETKVYDEDLGYSGTFDLLCYYDAELDGKSSKNSGLFVLDWKTNKDLYKNYKGKKLLSPFDGLLDMPLSIYKLQLSLYENCLEKIGMKVVARRIMWLLPNGNYTKIPLESYVKQLRKELSIHRIITD